MRVGSMQRVEVRWVRRSKTKGRSSRVVRLWAPGSPSQTFWRKELVPGGEGGGLMLAFLFMGKSSDDWTEEVK